MQSSTIAINITDEDFIDWWFTDILREELNVLWISQSLYWQTAIWNNPQEFTSDWCQKRYKIA